MEPAIATDGNRPQIGWTREPRKQAESVAHRLPPVACDGKEGVDSSSPSETSLKPLHRGALC